MNTLPGNPYEAPIQDNLDHIHEWQSAEGDTDATRMAQIMESNIDATLALAYEQRTANLIAIQRMGVTDMTDWAPAVIDAWGKRAMEISVRLGYVATK